MNFVKGPSSEVIEPTNVDGARIKGLTRRDEQDMAEQGKRQRFNRNFGFLSMLGFTTTSKTEPNNSGELTDSNSDVYMGSSLPSPVLPLFSMAADQL